MWRTLIDTACDRIWPLHCVSCGRPSDSNILCGGCVVSLVPGAGACCPHCGLVWLDPPPGGGEHYCGGCLSDPPPWARARAAFAYGGALRDVVARWKNRPDDALGPWLGRWFAAEAAACGWPELAADTLVVPMPAHPRRIRKRGFFPAGQLARALATRLDLELDTGALIARKPLAPSKGLTRAGRARRLGGAFAGRPSRLVARPVLLVDDVMTTGATARAATRACLRAGAHVVHVGVLARAPFGDQRVREAAGAATGPARR